MAHPQEEETGWHVDGDGTALGIKVMSSRFFSTIVRSANPFIPNLFIMGSIYLWRQEKAKQGLSHICMEKELSEIPDSNGH